MQTQKQNTGNRGQSQPPGDVWPAFLAHLYRGGAVGYWWQNPPKVTIWYDAGNPAPVPSYGNVYYGVHPTAAIPKRWKEGRELRPEEMRATIVDVAAVNCLFAEYDAKDYGDKAAILAHIDALAARPSVLIDSGGGIHAYWLFRDPFILARQEDRERARLLQAAWVVYVRGDDGAKDLARVLRVPGTLNCKYDPPRPVTILRADLAQLYNLPDLETLARPPEPREVPARNGNGRGPAEDSGQYWLDKALAKAAPGNRNATGFWLACQLRDSGMGQAEAEGWLLAYARSVPQPPGNYYGDGEATASLAEAFKGTPREPARGATPQRSAPARAETPTDEPPAWLGDDDGAGGQDLGAPADNAALPQIVVTNRPMPAVTTEAMGALQAANNPPALFVRSGTLARVRTDERGRPVIDDIDAPVLRGSMARAALWYKVVKGGELRHVPPPDDIVQDALALGGWPFPALEAISETPALRIDGTILDRPGYDPATGLYYVPSRGFQPPTVPSHPTAEELAAAVALVDECIGDFPYCDDASKANAWALLLTPILRPAIVGNTPLALIDKPQAGTGASLLAEAVSILATGRQAAMMTAPADDTEWRKRITAALLEGATVITIDNVETTLQSASLAAALTSSTWKDRVLGQSATVVLSQRATWLATGNNIRLGGDMPRRCYWIRLDAQTSQPWRRQNFRHPGLIGWVTENRGQLLGALLTIARAWWAAGCPAAAVAPLGSFESWARTVGGVLTYAGIRGFLGNLDALYERVDEEGTQWQRFFETWFDVIGDGDLSVAELVARLKAGIDDPAKDADGAAMAEALPDALAGGPTDPKRAAGFPRQLGKALAKRADMTFDETGLRLVRQDDAHKKTARWRVKRMQEAL